MGWPTTSTKTVGGVHTHRKAFTSTKRVGGVHTQRVVTFTNWVAHHIYQDGRWCAHTQKGGHVHKMHT